jgi:hypothetical protein
VIMIIEQNNGEGLSKEQQGAILTRKEFAYRAVVYTQISPRELDEDLVIKIDNPVPMTQEDKRAAKLVELEIYRKACLCTQNELRSLGDTRFTMKFLMENGFGLGAGNFLDEEGIDELITKDEQIPQRKKEK